VRPCYSSAGLLGGTGGGRLEVCRGDPGLATVSRGPLLALQRAIPVAPALLARDGSSHRPLIWRPAGTRSRSPRPSPRHRAGRPFALPRDRRRRARARSGPAGRRRRHRLAPPSDATRSPSRVDGALGAAKAAERQALAATSAGLPDPLAAWGSPCARSSGTSSTWTGRSPRWAPASASSSPPTRPARRCSARAPGSGSTPRGRGSPRRRPSRASAARTARTSSSHSPASTRS
jgi:hypothetical protein